MGIRPIDLTHMDRALTLARKAETLGEVPVGAVLISDETGEVVGEGYNQPITLNDPSAHAEMLALRQAGERLGNYRLVGTTLYVTLEPCAMCAMAMVHARVGRVVFGAADPRTGAAGSVYNLVDDPRLNHRLTVDSGAREEEAAMLLRSFFRSRREAKKALKQALKQGSAQAEKPAGDPDDTASGPA